MRRAVALVAAAALLAPAAPADARKPRVRTAKACAKKTAAVSVARKRRCMRMHQRFVVPWLGPVAPVAATGGQEGTGPGGTPGPGAAPPPPPPPPPPVDDPHRLQVRSGEFFLALSQPAVDSGDVTVEFNNEFAEDPHDLVIEGNGDVHTFSELGPGGVSEKVFALEDGDYQLFCAVLDHAQRGMQATLHVR